MFRRINPSFPVLIVSVGSRFSGHLCHVKLKLQTRFLGTNMSQQKFIAGLLSIGNLDGVKIMKGTV